MNSVVGIQRVGWAAVGATLCAFAIGATDAPQAAETTKEGFEVELLLVAGAEWTAEGTAIVSPSSFTDSGAEQRSVSYAVAFSGPQQYGKLRIYSDEFVVDVDSATPHTATAWTGRPDSPDTTRHYTVSIKPSDGLTWGSIIHADDVEFVATVVAPE